MRAAFIALASLAVSSVALAGCFATSGASPNAIPLVRYHAEKDLDCPAADIRIEQKLGGKFKAIGCGHKVEYQTACDGLQCVVYGEGEKAVPAWRDRPEPVGSPGDHP